MNAIDITIVVNAVIALLATVIGVAVVPWIHTKFDAEEMSAFLRWVEIGVAAAEQIYKATEGEKKKLYVVKYLQSKGYTVDAEDIDNAIEAAVLKLHADLYGQTLQHASSYSNPVAQPLEVHTALLNMGGNGND